MAFCWLIYKVQTCTIYN